MKKRIALTHLRTGILSAVCFLILLLGIAFTPAFSTAVSPAAIASAASTSSSEADLISDQASLLTANDLLALEDTILALESKYSVSIRILAERDLNGESTTHYLEDYFDREYAAGLLSADAVLILISMEPGNRIVEIQGYGICEELLSYRRIDAILDDITPLLRSGKYRLALDIFLERTDYYLGYEEVPFYFSTLFQLIVALVIGAATVAILLPRDSGRVTTNSRTYMVQEHSGVTASRDIYLRTLVTKTRRPDSGPGGGSRNTGGRSPGGASHSGGSRSF